MCTKKHFFPPSDPKLCRDPTFLLHYVPSSYRIIILPRYCLYPDSRLRWLLFDCLTESLVNVDVSFSDYELWLSRSNWKFKLIFCVCLL